MAEFKLKKGFDIRLTASADKIIANATQMARFALKPTDFRGIKTKLEVEVGQNVKAGTALFHGKENTKIKFTAPVSGKVSEINRGERRVIQEIVIQSDGRFESLDFGKTNLKSVSTEEVKNLLLKSGLWPTLVQRPFGVLADPLKVARDIFISGFDTAPLSADPYFQLDKRSDDFKAGLETLKKLTSGSVYLSLDGNRTDIPDAFKNLSGIEVNNFSGKHPAGLVGVQIHHIKPINKDEIIWTVKVQDVAAIGALISTGKINSDIIVAISGENVHKPKYYRSKRGASFTDLSNVVSKNSRIISGDVFTGKKIEKDGFLGFSDSTFSVIPEGNQREFLGWILPGFNKGSFSGTFLSKFFPKKKYSMNTNLHGGHRNFVQTGYYEQVLPMDIYPMHLLKACLSEDIENMEGLGIYELIEEDIALCEYICPSKSEMQEMLSEGIDLMIRES